MREAEGVADMRRSAEPPWRCLGIAGWLLGHSFTFGSEYNFREHCARCGMPRGGWTQGASVTSLDKVRRAS